MGMDLYAVKPAGGEGSEHFHANWTGWGILRDLLIELGCDTSRMAGSNDGERVPAATARAWGKAVNEAVDAGRIVILRYPDSSYAGGFREEMRVVGTQTPVVMSTHELARAVIRSVREDLESQGLPHYGSASDDEKLDVPPQQIPLVDDPESVEWLRRFAWFCATSGGFRQY